MMMVDTPTRIGAFILTKTLGQGGHAVVKLGVHETTGAKLAIKLTHKNSPNRFPSVQHRVEQEARTMSQLKHPNIASFVGLVETEHAYAMAMEYIADGDLHTFIRKNAKRGHHGGLPMDQAFSIFYQVVSALDYCHNVVGIAHRDIKPENILVNKTTGVVKLTDFGISNTINDDRLMETACGSPHYACPEIIRGSKYDGRAADVWSLGVVLFTLCFGRLPFKDDNLARLFEMICRGTYTMPFGFDSELCDLISRLLDVNVACRIPLAEVKKHPWWLRNCDSLGLCSDGVLGVNVNRVAAKGVSAAVCKATATTAAAAPRRQIPNCTAPTFATTVHDNLERIRDTGARSFPMRGEPVPNNLRLFANRTAEATSMKNCPNASIQECGKSETLRIRMKKLKLMLKPFAVRFFSRKSKTVAF